METKEQKLISVRKQIKKAEKFAKETRIEVKIGKKTKFLDLEKFYQYKKNK